MEPEIYTQMLKKLSEKLRAKFLTTTPGCSMVKIVHLDDASLRLVFTSDGVVVGVVIKSVK